MAPAGASVGGRRFQVAIRLLAETMQAVRRAEVVGLAVMDVRTGRVAGSTVMPQMGSMASLMVRFLSSKASGGRKPPERSASRPALHSGGSRPPLARCRILLGPGDLAIERSSQQADELADLVVGNRATLGAEHRAVQFPIQRWACPWPAG